MVDYIFEMPEPDDLSKREDLENLKGNFYDWNFEEREKNYPEGAPTSNTVKYLKIKKPR